MHFELQENNTRALMRRGDTLVILQGITENIIRCVVTKKEQAEEDSAIGVIRGAGETLTVSSGEDGTQTIGTSRLRAQVDPENGRLRWFARSRSVGGDRPALSAVGAGYPDGTDSAGPQSPAKESAVIEADAESAVDMPDSPWRLLLNEGERELTETPVQVWTTGGEAPVIRRVRTVDGDRNFVENLKPETDHMAWRAKLHFRWQEGEHIYGFGQGEEGIYDHRGHVQYLYQHNMRIPMPWILSSKGYAILVDCGCLMTFNDDERGSYLYLDNVEQLDYYIIAGDRADELITGYRRLTGRASMLPKWAYGYVQSKERYEDQEELVRVAREYRSRGIGLDCVVQDWKTWVGDRWGEKKVDPQRFPDLKKMREELHGLHVHSMVSVWPNMNYDTDDCAQMQEAGYLLHDLATYDAFEPQARKLYWQQAQEGLYQDGFDSWWCDSTEPFSGPDWGGETIREPWERFELVGSEHKKFLGPQRANLYALAHVQGMYENQRETDPAHRMLNLTRSGYAGIQRYGAMLWSGDISATWETLRKQITEGLNMALSGIPYWTLDAGAFFVVKENWQARGCGCNEDPTPKWFWHGDYEKGIEDPAYRELYVRWLQLAGFLPMMRSHGTDAPREIWQFGEPGEPFYDAIADAIALRYRLMPYIYSLAGSVRLDDAPLLRPLLMDFAVDARAAGSHESFLFGPSLLVCPVTKPMYFERGGVPIAADLDADQYSWPCYLPAGADWYDLHTGERYAGGQEITVSAPISRIPVFAKAGSIIPMERELLYADQKADTPLELHIYPGADGDFLYYEDAGDGHDYEDGAYNRIALHWDDRTRVLTFDAAKHRFDGGLAGRTVMAVCGQERFEAVYTGERMQIHI